MLGRFSPSLDLAVSVLSSAFAYRNGDGSDNVRPGDQSDCVCRRTLHDAFGDELSPDEYQRPHSRHRPRARRPQASS